MRQQVNAAPRSRPAVSTAREMLNKVPEVTIFFWIIKILATTVGETAADFLGVNLNFGLTVTTVVMSALLAVALVFQFRTNRYKPGIYWLSVVLISVVGTLNRQPRRQLRRLTRSDHCDLRHRHVRHVRRLVRE